MERAKNKIATTATLQGERPLGRMQAVGMQWLYQKRYSPLAVELEKMMKITIDDVRRVFQQDRFGPATILSLKPAGE